MSLLQRRLGQISEDAPVAADLPAPPVASAQRFRVGLTGLAAIFLLVLVATAGLRPGVERGTPQTVDEPLAVLGVAPAAPVERPPIAAPPAPQ
jgi:hypothetical protein